MSWVPVLFRNTTGEINGFVYGGDKGVIFNCFLSMREGVNAHMTRGGMGGGGTSVGKFTSKKVYKFLLRFFLGLFFKTLFRDFL